MGPRSGLTRYVVAGVVVAAFGVVSVPSAQAREVSGGQRQAGPAAV